MLKGIEMIYDKQLVSKRYNGENFESVVLLSLMDLIGLNGVLVGEVICG